ncbi:hypothetical protein QBC44DRAFT_307561 [Cladorrhinum sp. PSN332]|nr:hypothetical protein QBC44DRAFT_307561 [Cladorrhinum sp. PSN332]
MKFTTFLALLPALTLANPLAARQSVGQAAFVGRPLHISGNCRIIGGNNTASGQSVTLQHYKVNYPGANNEPCTIRFTVQHPIGTKTVRVNATHHIKSDTPANSRVVGWLWRNYVVFPGAQITPPSFQEKPLPTGSAGKDYVDQFNVTTSNLRVPTDITYEWQGRLRLQESGPGGVASAEQTSFKFDIIGQF